MCFRPPEMNRRIKRCPSCQTANPPALTQCKKCGAVLPAEADFLNKAAGTAPGHAASGDTAPGAAAPPGVSPPGVIKKDKDPESNDSR
jgi:molybdopterin-biosynthesis enzyme MoeA-like protein